MIEIIGCRMKARIASLSPAARLGWGVEASEPVACAHRERSGGHPGWRPVPGLGR